MKITKKEWEDKVYKQYYSLFNVQLPVGEYKVWWRSPTSFRLSQLGFARFKQANIYFFKFDIPQTIKWTGGLILKLSKMPCPHFFSQHQESALYYTDKHYAVMIKLIDLDLDTLLKEFENENV